MSKRAEEAALYFYPQRLDKYREVAEVAAESRRNFILGYEQAEKDTIERAIQWLIAHVDDYIVDMEVSRYKPSKLHVGGKCLDELKKAMENE